MSSSSEDDQPNQPNSGRRATNRYQAGTQVACQSPGNLRRNNRRRNNRRDIRLERRRAENALVFNHHLNVCVNRRPIAALSNTYVPPFITLHLYLFPIGTHVRKAFDGVYYDGYCTAYVTRDGTFHYYKISYEDNDVEDVDQQEMLEIAVAMPRTTTTLTLLADAVFF